MAVCKQCGEEVEELHRVSVGGKAKKVCEECADRLREEGEVAEESQRVVRGMMEYKGKG